VSIVTLRPNADSNVQWTPSSGGSRNAMLNDDSDSTYISNTSAGTSVYSSIEVGTTTLTATQRIKAVRFRHRAKMNTAAYLQLKFVSFGQSASKAAITWARNSASGIINQASAWFTTDAHGDAWNQQKIDTLQLREFGSGGTDAVRVYEQYVDVDVRNQPVITGAPNVTGNTTTAQPTVDWAYSDVDGDPQNSYQLKIFTAAQFAAPGFDAETSPNTWDSGVQLNGASSAVVGIKLVSGVSYRACVKVGKNFNGSPWFSAWVASAAFTILTDTVPIPTITITPDNVLPRIRNLIRVDAEMNLLSGPQASFESVPITGTGGWVAGAFTKITPTGTQHLHGVSAMSMQNISGVSNTIFANTTPNAGGFAVKAGQPYLAIVFFRAVATGRPCKTRVAFYDWNGVYIAGGDMLSPAVNDVTTGFTQCPVFGVAPAGARTAAIEVQAGVGTLTVANEIHIVDQVAMIPLTLGNLLFDNQASMESAADPLGLESKVNCSAGRTQAQALDGLASFAVTGAGAGDMKAGTADAYRIPIDASWIGSTITGRYAVRALSTTRPAKAELLFFNALSGGSNIATLSGSNVTDSNTAWTEPIFVTGTIPAGAVAVELRFTFTGGALNEVHFIEKASVTIGDSTRWSSGVAWSAGGLSNVDTVRVEFTDWTPVHSRLINMLNPQIANAGKVAGGIAGSIDGFFKRYNEDLVEFDHTVVDSPLPNSEGVIAWTVGQPAFSEFDFGTAKNTYDPTYTFPCVPGLQVTFSVYAKARVGTHSCKLFVYPIDQTGAQVGLGTETNSGTQTVDTTWRRLQATITPPPGAVGLRGMFENSNGDLATYLFEGLQLELGSVVTAFHDGQGQIPAWQPVRDAYTALVTDARTAVASVFDREAAPGVVRMYRARTLVTFSDGTTVASDYSTYVQTRLNLLGRGNWIISDPQQPALNILVDVTTPLPESIDEDLQELHPIRPNAVQDFGQRPVVSSDWISGDNGTLTIIVTSERDWYTLKQLARTKRSLLLRFPEGGQRYIRFNSRSWPRTPQTTSCDPNDFYRRVLNAQYVQTERPVVLQ
jgi:hypothetical protein